MLSRINLKWRFQEAWMLLVVYLAAGVAYASVGAALALRAGQDPQAAIQPALLPALVIVLAFSAVHITLSVRGLALEQTILPVVALLFVIGSVMIYRLRGDDGFQQQVVRGLVPGMLALLALLIFPQIVERIRRWAVPIGLLGLLVLFLTSAFGAQDETGARLALRLGPISVQTSEVIKLALIIFLAWYIEHEGRAAEGRAHTLLWFRLPAARYLAPAALFIGAATLTLVAMSDFGAVLVLGILFVAMLYTGFATRIFATISALGLGLGLVVGLVLSQTWSIPATIQYRYLAYRNPWSAEMMPTGYTIAEGPGYQIQQALYAVIAGGVSGSGLGLGSPTFIPLAHSDFILAAILEEMGSAVGLAVIVLFAVLVLRIFRLALLLPPTQVFERLLLVGIGVHFFSQVFIMAGGTLNLFPLTGVTVPFLSQGGAALMVNLVEVGIVLALAQRVQGWQAQGGQA